MMYATSQSGSYFAQSSSLLSSVLDRTEVGVVVIDSTGRAVYMNSSARNLLQAPNGVLPEWAGPEIEPMLDQLGRCAQVIERWTTSDMVLRVRARPLEKGRNLMTVLEITVAHAGGGRHVAEQLSRSLELTISDAKLLALLWRGMSNDEIAQLLNVRVGTVKSRLFRLYQKLGVKRRPAAVLRAAEVLGA